MNTFLSPFKHRKRPLFHLADGYLFALALNAIAVLIMITAIVALSLQAHASSDTVGMT